MSDAQNTSEEEGLEDDLGEEGAQEAIPGDDADLNEGLSDEDGDAPLAQPAMSGAKGTAFMGVPIEIIISVGKARPLVSELVNLRRDSVITLDSKIDDPVEIFIGDRLIARGELQEMENEEGQLGVRLTEVADLSNGV